MSDRADGELTQAASLLLARYAWAIDDRAYADLQDVFTQDAVADYGAFTCRGLEELVERMEEIHRGLRGTQHLVGSVLATARLDGSATVRSHVRATLVRGGDAGGRVEVAASYRDRLVATPAGHRIAERRVEGHWVTGDRSILPWLHERSHGRTDAHTPATSPDDRGI